MSKTFRIQIGAALLALSSGAVTAPAAAQDNLPQAAAAVGHAIAAQGNAALIEIRREIGERLLQQIKPILPKPATETSRPVPAPTPATALARK